MIYGGPAFPQAHDDSGSPGMTLRDYFAAKAMHAMLSASSLAIDLCEESSDLQRNAVACLAEGAYEMADAMLKERNK